MASHYIQHNKQPTSTPCSDTYWWSTTTGQFQDRAQV